MSIELFSSGELLDDNRTEAILREEAGEFATGSTTDASFYDYRRRFLGPAADVTHPEFGRSNRPEETFGVRYHITSQVEVVSYFGNKELKEFTVVEERIYDADKNLVATKKTKAQ